MIEKIVKIVRILESYETLDENGSEYIKPKHYNKMASEILEAINYTRCCKSDSDQLCDHIYFDNTHKPDNCIYCNYKREPK